MFQYMQKRNLKKHNKDVENTWDSFWGRKNTDLNENDANASGVLSKIKNYILYLEKEYNLDRWYKEALLREIPATDNLLIMDAGCGEGKTVHSIYNKNYFYHLLDISPNALNLSKNKFKQSSYNAEYVSGSIFEFPIRSNSYDIVLSIGILEHFTEDQHRELYDEMVRIIKPGGKIITLVPNRKAYFYTIGKWYAQKNGFWEFGYEEPFYSLKHLYKDNNEVKHLKEYSGGALTQFYFTMLLFKKVKIIKMAFITFVAIINRLLWKLNNIDFFGFYLVNITEKTKNIL